MPAIGQRFGKLVVLSQARTHKGQPRFNLKCDCGNVTVVRSSNLQKKGGTKSCGCLRRGGGIKHAQHRTHAYRAWDGAKQRCFNPRARYYGNFGGRGITMCERWRNSFEAFLADMGAAPERTRLTRRNRDGNYEPGNCYWLPRYPPYKS